ncbi:iron-containing alcohol dehydrogenase [Gracilibacillus alcaliphilus]|uniref:iron-containing alcohol dehydrogenase n=1 Tax=Gracilibacillus alcaliphilus TaxID=1401441 RepID=UPI0019593381|nr:iron-containing alcohol dehydrogenase [Gracilibacillus alcaliphilus]MBM7677829.1 alcohol dehydrogenase YqhD (iron-dependent ADH family) [Gracilibacillus alcaliphilus]
MRDFTFHNPTRLHFGTGQLKQLSSELEKYGNKVLLVYGGGSIKRNGLYDQVIAILKQEQKTVMELSGVEPNPRVTTARKGIDICKTEKIDFILAVGGGSTIDCVKAIAAGAKSEHDIWDIVTKKAAATDALPFGTILTLAATGSEMNSGSVITNWETKEKHGWGSPYTYPVFSILDPEFTKTVPADQTVYGIVDIMSHAFEHYFHHETNTLLQDRMVEGILQTMVETAPKLVADLKNEEYRATVLYNGTMALNGMVNMGYQGDWATHNLEHAVSAVHDIPHGGGLAILFPHWMEYVIDENPARAKQFAVRVFGIDPADKTDKEIGLSGIQALRSFWNQIGAPSRLTDYGIGEDSIEEMADKTVTASLAFGRFKQLTREDAVAIYKAAL